MFLETSLVMLIIVLASGLQGFSGFGFGLALMMALPFFIPITTATVLATVSVTFISLYMVWRNRESIDLTQILYPLIGSFLFIPVGVYLLNHLNEEVLKMVLGSLLVLLSGFFLLNGAERAVIQSTKGNGLLAGILGGTLTGMLSIGGPPLVIYFLHAAKDKLSYKTSLDFIFFVTSVFRLFWLALYGNINMSMAPLLAGSVIAGIIGTMIGFKMMIKTDKAAITKTVYVVMILAGLSLVFL